MSEVARTDQMLASLYEQILEKKRLLRDQEKAMRVGSRTNLYLDEVAGNYAAYNDFIRKQREQQKQSLIGIIEYLEGLSQNTDLNNERLEQIKRDQEQLLLTLRDLQQEGAEEMEMA
jgi:hypothetical protein